MKNTIQARAITKLCETLDRLGATYAIMHTDGQWMDATTQTHVEKGKKQAVKAQEAKVPLKKVPVKRSFATTEYTTKVAALQPGELVQFKRADYMPLLKTNVAWNSFGASVKAKATYQFGSGNSIVEIRKETVTILRVQ